jgi:hypothetical protein
MKRPALSDVFDIPGQSYEPRPFHWTIVLAVAAIVIGAAMVLVAASEDRISSAPQVTIGH